MTHRTTIGHVCNSVFGCIWLARPLPQCKIGIQTFMTWKFFQSRQAHQLSRFLENCKFNLLFGHLSSFASNPTLYRKILRCDAKSLPFLFRSQFFISVGFRSRSFGIRIVVTGPVIVRTFCGHFVPPSSAPARCVTAAGLCQPQRNVSCTEYVLVCTNHETVRTSIGQSEMTLQLLHHCQTRQGPFQNGSFDCL